MIRTFFSAKIINVVLSFVKNATEKNKKKMKNNNPFVTVKDISQTTRKKRSKRNMVI